MCNLMFIQNKLLLHQIGMYAGGDYYIQVHDLSFQCIVTQASLFQLLLATKWLLCRFYKCNNGFKRFVPYDQLSFNFSYK